MQQYIGPRVWAVEVAIDSSPRSSDLQNVVYNLKPTCIVYLYEEPITDT